MLFKILQGDKSRISLDITPFHEGWCYVTTDGGFYVDMNIGTVEVPSYQRVEVTSKSAYQIAVQQGFEGDEAAWLESLKGEPGVSGVWVGSEEPPEGYVVQIDLTGEVEESPKIQIETHNSSETAHPDIRNIIRSIPVSDIVTKDNRYEFIREVGGITYTQTDHATDIVYGGSFTTALTPGELVGRAYYGWTFGAISNSGYVSLSAPKSGYTEGDSTMIVNFNWNVDNLSDATRPAINGALIGIYNTDNFGNEEQATYFDSYKYFGRITNNAFVGTINSQGQYEETMYEFDREGVQRNITYPALQLTSWGQNSTTKVVNNIYSGAIVLDISNLKPGNYKVMFVNYVCPDWPVENIVESMPYQILAEMPITIYEKEV